MEANCCVCGQSAARVICDLVKEDERHYRALPPRYFCLEHARPAKVIIEEE